ncbi:hypothetical protein FRC17_004661, partial [Serendipita sp. 399]
AVSFSHAIPGERPDVRSVVQWPGQPEASSESKIPTIVAYQGGEAKFFGAEAREYLEDEDYEIARWFKLRLHPDSMKIQPIANKPDELDIPPLPRGTSLVQVYADFIRYIYKVTKNFFTNKTPTGQQIWSRLENRMPIIFCVPNGWDIRQHAVITDAAKRSGIVTEHDAEDRLWFLTEGEASVHYALAHSKTVTWLNDRTIFAVTDVGGSTVDSTLYRCQSRIPLILEEVCASACVQAGGIFVDQRIREILREKLTGSEYSEPEFLSLMVQHFEQKTKRAFDGSQAPSVIKFGSPRDNDAEHNIIKGKLTLSYEEVEAAYLGVVSSIVSSCRKLLMNHKVQHLILVGGFGESPYLKEQLKSTFRQLGTEVVTLEEPSYVSSPGHSRETYYLEQEESGSVIIFPPFVELHLTDLASDGAVIWYLTELVEGRAARFDYGLIVSQLYEVNRHSGYEKHCFIHDELRFGSGQKRFNKFDVLVPKNTVFNDRWRVTWTGRKVFTGPTTSPGFGKLLTEFAAWRLDDPAPNALGQGSVFDSSKVPGLEQIFSVEADMGAACNSAQPVLNPTTGTMFWRVDCSLDLMYKNLRLVARIRWKEKGIERVGPATIVPAIKL